MRISTARWLLWTPAAAIVLALAVLSIDSERIPCFLSTCDGGPLQGLVRQREAATRAASVRWAEVRAMDDISAAVRLLPPPTPATGPATISFSSDVSEPVRRAVRAAIDAERTLRAPWHSRGRVAIVVASDTATLRGTSTARRWNLGRGTPVSTRVLPPQPLTQGRCVTIIRLRSLALRGGYAVDRERPPMDACSLVDAFGIPGRAIAAALDSGRWRSARIHAPSVPDSIRRLRHRVALAGFAFDGVDDAPCAAGRADACERLITRQLSHAYGQGWQGYGSPGALDIPFLTTDPEFYSRAEAMLFDAIIAEIGPAAFDKVWRDDAPFAEAYRAGNGRPLAELASEAVRSGFGFPDGRRTAFGANVARSGTASLRATILTLALIAGIGLLTARLTGRPRIGG